MSAVATAVIGSSVIGAVASTSNAKRQIASAERMEANSLAFDREQYEDWLSVYGPIQDNLGEYYNTIDGEFYEVTGLQQFQEEFQTSMQLMEENLAQRGLSGSALEASLESQAELNAAEKRAEIRRDAPRLAAEDKSNFLQIGMGSNPASTLSNNLDNRASTARQGANAATQAAGQAVGQAISTTGTAAADYFRTNPVSSTPAPQPVPANLPGTGPI